MSTCARCGVRLTNESWKECSDEDTQASEAHHYQCCLERQLSNQASLLRSVTGKLEELHTILLDDEYGPKSTPVMLIDSVLEVLS